MSLSLSKFLLFMKTSHIGLGPTLSHFGGTQVVQTVKSLPAMQKTWVRSLRQEGSLEKEMATHSNILAWEIPCL